MAIFFVVNCLIKMLYSEPEKIRIDASSLALIIIDIVIRYHGLSK